MRRRSKPLYQMLQDKAEFTIKYSRWLSLALTNALLDAGEDTLALRAEEKYAMDKDGRALAQAFLAGAKEYADFLTGFQTSKDLEEHKRREDVPMDFNFEDYTEDSLEMPTRGQQKGTE